MSMCELALMEKSDFSTVASLRIFPFSVRPRFGGFSFFRHCASVYGSVNILQYRFNLFIEFQIVIFIMRIL